MTDDCDDDAVARDMPIIPSGGGIVDGPGETRLQATIKDVPANTLRRDCDQHTAITRGLAEYIASLRGSHLGRDVSLARVSYNYPDRSQAGEPVFPAAAVYSTGDDLFTTFIATNVPVTSYHQIGPSVPGKLNTYLQPVDTFTMSELKVEVECADPEQRIGVNKMLIDAARPVDWTNGLRLILPHYHNEVAYLTLEKASMGDTPELVASGIRLLLLTFSAQIQTYQVRKLPGLVQARTPGTIGIGNT